MKQHLFAALLIFSFISCHSQPGPGAEVTQNPHQKALKQITAFDTTSSTIHIFVALCDNKYQGIVPVPPKIGNGQDPDNNLYWGCGYGIRSYFRNSREWKLIQIRKPDSIRLERLVFKHVSENQYLVADAYDGKYIRTCTEDFLRGTAGKEKDTLHVQKKVIGISGNAELLAYTGHDGLMDFELTESFKNMDNRKRDVIILACFSKDFFSNHLDSAHINPLVWTTGLMCPEAYTIHDAITGYLNHETNEQIRSRAASAYQRFQKCGLGAARNLLVTGW